MTNYALYAILIVGIKSKYYYHRLISLKKGVLDMNKRMWIRRIATVLTASAMIAEMTIPFSKPAYAQNRLFISDIRLEAGADAVEKLEADGYQVLLVGLNYSPEPETQVYIGYKLNEGSPITNVILSDDVGDTLTTPDGITYDCASHVDVDTGLGGGTGCLYVTRDSGTGAPLVGLDVLRGNADDSAPLYAITNDGAEIVRTPSGTPADMERNSETSTIYLTQTRDGIVRPYISEIGVVTDIDKWNAVYTACERGYNYYVDGDIDGSAETYTIIAYKRTADVEDAVTNLVAISADTVQSLEEAQYIDTSVETDEESTVPAEPQERLTAAVVGISGIEYVRVSSKSVSGDEPFYLYQTKMKEAGNPVSMLYAETLEETANFLFSTWAMNYFFSKGETNASSFAMNEDLYEDLENDLTVYTKLPVKLIDSFTPTVEKVTEEVTEETTVESVEETTEELSEDVTEPSDESESDSGNSESNEESTLDERSTEEDVPDENVSEEPKQSKEQFEEVSEPSAEESPSETMNQPTQELRTVGIAMLTARDGLPEGAISLSGIREDSVQLPILERTERSDRKNKFPASIFTDHGIAALVAGAIALLVATVTAIVICKKTAKKEQKANKHKKSR